NLSEKPEFTVLIANLDEEKRTVCGFTWGGDYRSGRLDRWRFEIRDDKGNLLPVIRLYGLGGGVFARVMLEFGESWHNDFPLRAYSTIAAPGKYTMRVYYHNETTIAGSEDIDERITFRSDEIKLEVTPIPVWVTEKQRREAKEWISELPEKGPVKMVIGSVK